VRLLLDPYKLFHHCFFFFKEYFTIVDNTNLWLK